jgi:hypothetical protein
MNYETNIEMHFAWSIEYSTTFTFALLNAFQYVVGAQGLEPRMPSGGRFTVCCSNQFCSTPNRCFLVIVVIIACAFHPLAITRTLVLPTPVRLNRIFRCDRFATRLSTDRLSIRTTRRNQPTSYRAGHTSC